MRIQQLGYRQYYLHYRDMMVSAGSQISIPAYNELFLIVDSPTGFRVDSDYGRYDTTQEYPPHDNIHEHRGEIRILNSTDTTQWIKMIQVILIN